jgi:imidazolonepropionase-like amidohydrolase
LIAAGTDAGNIGTLHGPALHRELELMARAGLSPQEILVAATRGGAYIMGRESELGTIEKGKLADLVLLDADPLTDIRHTRRVYRVVKGGALLDPEQILKNLE